MKVITLIIVLILAVSCGQKKAEAERITLDTNIPPAYVPVDNRKGEQFIAVLHESGDSISLSKNELDTIEELLQDKIREYNIGKDKENLVSLINYKRQYFPAINLKGEKEVEVNCFCQVHANDNWKKYRVSVKDGGNCYFNLKLNLTKGSVLHFNINGEA